MQFTKKDFYFSVLTGCITGFAAWRILQYLSVAEFRNHSFAWLMLIVPILWIIGVNLGYFFGGWFGFFNQFGKFAAIGFTNAAVDFGVLNLLIANTGISSGGWYPVFKGISFIAAVIPRYFWNKYWAFRPAADVARAFGNQRPVSAAQRDGNIGSGTLGTGGFEFAKFMSVAVVSILINTGTASLVVNYIHPLGGLSPAVWANAGAVAGSAVALIFSFVGFKVAVFKK